MNDRLVRTGGMNDRLVRTGGMNDRLVCTGGMNDRTERAAVICPAWCSHSLIIGGLDPKIPRMGDLSPFHCQFPRKITFFFLFPFWKPEYLIFSLSGPGPRDPPEWVIYRLSIANFRAKLHFFSFFLVGVIMWVNFMLRAKRQLDPRKAKGGCIQLRRINKHRGRKTSLGLTQKKNIVIKVSAITQWPS
ncbi:hypothetical protein CEXT_133451 [Caerostris extrusa]|uniref:Uncharacterized protein n=1 Tax=Caerostris extrusa TaxID=172846 RepID=A0AAV4MEA3_CAEEX|nr:hypothetical protein CEXT_133451 [Caerostris extrusa]